MKNSNSHLKIKSLLLCLVLFTLKLTGQNFEIDVSLGVPRSKLIYHHNSEIKGTNSYNSNGNLFMIGFTSKEKNNFRLRTELGFLSLKNYISISYKYDQGQGLQTENINSFLLNQKLYVGILPEYVKNKKNHSFFLNGGLLLATNITKGFGQIPTGSMNSGFQDVLGVSINSGIIFKISSIGLKFNAGYSRFFKEPIFSRYEPYTSSQNINLLFGIVYNVTKN
jgi:hypothetical protein